MDMTKIKEKVNQGKTWIKEKTEPGVKAVGKFIDEHGYLVIPMISVAGSLVAGVVASANEKSKDYEEKCLVEDDITGQNFKTKHPMTNAEILELGERMIDGQPKGDALDAMGLLKNEKRR